MLVLPMWPHCPAALECARKQSEHAHNPTRLACPALAAVALRGPQSLLPAALLYGCWLQTEFQLRWITVATPNRHRLDYRITVVVARSTLCGCWLQTEFQLRWSTVDTKQADANDYQQKQMPLSQLFLSDDFKRPWSYSFLGPQTCECERTYGCK